MYVMVTIIYMDVYYGHIHNIHPTKMSPCFSFLITVHTRLSFDLFASASRLLSVLRDLFEHIATPLPLKQNAAGCSVPFCPLSQALSQPLLTDHCAVC